MDYTEIKRLIQVYFDAGFAFEGERMKQVFHPEAHIYGRAEDGTLSDMDRELFVKIASERGLDGADAPFPRQDEILAIDFTGEHTAVARVKLRLGNIVFTDILSFLRLNGRWGVIAKVFSSVNEPHV